MLRKFVLGAVCGLPLVMAASPSLALDALMLPNAQTASTPNATAFNSTEEKDKDQSGSWHFRFSGDSSGYAHRNLFAPNSFGPNSDPSNPMGPMKTYGPPQTSTDPFFHN